MSAAFTPGPWAVGEDDQHGRAIVRSEHIEIATCWHHCVGSIEREMRSNASLIAAAPELLEALENIRWAHTDETDAQALAAIAKARGEQ